MHSNFAIATTLEERLTELGGIAPDRVRTQPPPGTATLGDLLQANDERREGLCELIDGCLVEKAMGYEASVVAIAIAHILRQFVAADHLGLVSGPDGFFKLTSSVRGPDVAYISVTRLPGGKLPGDAFPAIVPNLVVEVLSLGNTKAVMARKRLEYFLHGVQVAWMVDCVQRTVAVYTSPTDVVILGQAEQIDGGIAVPGFSAKVAEFFSDLDIGVARQ